MTTVKALDDLTPADLWQEVPLEEEFWQVARERQRYALKLLLESALEEEMVALVAAGRYRRTEVRQGYRNGYYQRDLAPRVGGARGVGAVLESLLGEPGAITERNAA